ncbi:thioredoxin family protein [Rufibacter psychrotolerans]|uniref:thioredoxin family protein n=1 Tax=Rufibacter psychrotolerans TaxID=2812556 RepID=UPI001967EA49|nr:thioredoxin family protein [Rufibacter sp. SYSU D00308]
MRFCFILVTFLALGAMGCARKTMSTTSADSSGYSSAENTGLNANENREEKNAAGTENILIGVTTRMAFDQAPYNAWFHPTYQRYTPNPKIMEQLEPLLEGVTIKAYIGSWCLDSQRDLPRFIKIMDQARIPHSRFQLISLREDKSGLTGSEKTDSVTAVPTFILYKNGKEMGRIVETAYPTMEMNMVTILQGTNPK